MLAQEELQDNPANSWFGHYTLSGRLGIKLAIPDLEGWIIMMNPPSIKLSDFKGRGDVFEDFEEYVNSQVKILKKRRYEF